MFNQKAIVLAVSGFWMLSGCAMLRGTDKSAAVKPAAAARSAVADSESLYRAGRNFQKQRRNELAADTFRKAIAANPQHVEAHNALGVIYSEQGLYQQAEQEFRAAVVAAAPDLSHLHNNLGYLYLQLGRTQDAAGEFRQAIKLDPTNLHAQNNLAAADQTMTRERAVAAAAETAAVMAVESTPAATVNAIEPAAPTPTVQVVTVGPNVWEIQPRASNPPATANEAAPAPAAASAPAAIADAVAVEAARIRLEVSNGNGTAGLAAGVGRLLRQQGYARARLTNLLPYNQAQTEIRYVAGYESIAQKLGAALQIPVRLVAVPQIDRQMQVQVVLGRDIAASDVAATARKPGVNYVVQLPPAPRKPATSGMPVDFKQPPSVKQNRPAFM